MWLVLTGLQTQKKNVFEQQRCSFTCKRNTFFWIEYASSANNHGNYYGELMLKYL